MHDRWNKELHATLPRFGAFLTRSAKRGLAWIIFTSLFVEQSQLGLGRLIVLTNLSVTVDCSPSLRGAGSDRSPPLQQQPHENVPAMEEHPPT